MIATITLNPSIDQHWIVPDFVKDDTNRAERLVETAGGKGINVSKVVRELGGTTAAYALLGGFTGERLLELARPLDFPIRTTRVKEETRTNMVLSDLKDRTQSRISAPGPRVAASEMRGFIRTLCAVRPRPRWWVFGGSLPRGLSPSAYREIIHALKAEGGRCVLDTDNEALRLGIQAKPYMIKPNEFELARLCGRKLKGLPDHLREARRLAESGIELVVVSLAAKGALFVTAREAFRVTTPRVPVASHIGAGDSLIGGLVWALDKGLPLERAALSGVAASTSAVMRGAPRLCRRADMAGLLRRLRVIRL